VTVKVQEVKRVGLPRPPRARTSRPRRAGDHPVVTPLPIRVARSRAKREGHYLGEPAKAPLWTWSGDRTHYLAARIYTLPGGERGFEPREVPMIEIWETHDRRKRARIVPAKDLVHALINLDPAAFVLAARRIP